MKLWNDYSKEELKKLLDVNRKKFEELKTKGYKLNLSRGKPSPDILDYSNDLLKSLDTYYAEDGTDIRNYGIIAGLPECKRLFSQLLEIEENKFIIGGNSSLSHMYNVFSFLYLFGTQGEKPWSQFEKVKILCPCPGYDRHFTLTADFGAEMIIVPMNNDGPDMDFVEELVASDPAVKGIWNVPLYSNPTGICYSDDTVKRLASMKTAAPDFRIFWDNSYGIHHIWDEHKLANILTLAEEAGNPHRPIYFFSTSKVTFPGGGIGLIATSEENVKELISHIKLQTIGYDKISQMRLVKMFDGDVKKIKAHMNKIADALRPKFELVFKTIDNEFEGTGLIEWTKPLGGYFVSINVLDDCAKKVVAMAKEAGAVMSGAGSTFPHGLDPKDRNIRIAPTYPNLEELEATMTVLSVCIKIVSAEKLLEKFA